MFRRHACLNVHRIEQIAGSYLYYKSSSPTDKYCNKESLSQSGSSILQSIDRKASLVIKENTEYAKDKATIKIGRSDGYASNYYQS